MLSLPFTASRLQVASYLCLVALFSISFLVFLNASISFVITERIGRRSGVGDAVGTLSFADELVALVFCPLWGAASDRVGVRTVAVAGYAIVGLGLWSCVWAQDVYPGLLIARMVFAVGGSATATMVTAILPTMTMEAPKKPTEPAANSSPQASNRHSIAPSVSSELTITPERFLSHSNTPPPAPPNDPNATASRLAGFVGMFTGLGALVALFVFLPLPTAFQKRSLTAPDSVAAAFYVVGGIAYVVALGCFFGLRKLPGEEEKSPRRLFKLSRSSREYEGGLHGALHHMRDSAHDAHNALTNESTKESLLSGPRSLLTAFTLSFHSPSLALGYIGGAVARAASVAISLFIPLAVNAHFIATGECSRPDSNLPEAPGADLKHTCAPAYRLASALSGVSQLAALVCAPIFGYVAATAGRRSGRWRLPRLNFFSDEHEHRHIRRHMRSRSGRIRIQHHGQPANGSDMQDSIVTTHAPRSNWYHWPLLLGALAGVIGYAFFSALPSPEPSGDDGSPVVFIAVVLMGIGQIGAIVCSLSLLSRGIQAEVVTEIKVSNGEGSAAITDSDLSASTSSNNTSAPNTPSIVVRPNSSSSATFAISRPSSSPGQQNGSFQAPSFETTPLLNNSQNGVHELPPHSSQIDRADLKGAIAGIYSLFGGLAILLLTKLGGLAFDRLSTASPFLIMVAANAVLLFIGVFLGVVGAVGREEVPGERQKDERRDAEP